MNRPQILEAITKAFPSNDPQGLEAYLAINPHNKQIQYIDIRLPENYNTNSSQGANLVDHIQSLVNQEEYGDLTSYTIQFTAYFESGGIPKQRFYFTFNIDS